MKHMLTYISKPTTKGPRTALPVRTEAQWKWKNEECLCVRKIIFVDPLSPHAQIVIFTYILVFFVTSVINLKGFDCHPFFYSVCGASWTYHNLQQRQCAMLWQLASQTRLWLLFCQMILSHASATTSRWLWYRIDKSWSKEREKHVLKITRPEFITVICFFFFAYSMAFFN